MLARRWFGCADAWRWQLAVVLLSSCLANASCTVDERDLRVDTAAASRGGAQDAGRGGLSDAGQSTRGGAGSGGTNAAHGGSSGISSAGSVGGSGSAGDTRDAGQNTGGASTLGGAGNGGNHTGGILEGGGAGAPLVGPCGDIDNDGVDDCTQTLAQNSGFDRDLSGWTPGADSEAAWDSRDARTEAGSGSLLVSNIAPTASAPAEVMVAVEQCLPVTGGSSYLLAARVLIPSEQGLGEGGINIWIFDGSGCQGTFLIAATPSSALATGAWTVVRGEAKMPPTAKSMLLRLAVSRPFAQSRLDVLFDDVLVKAK